MKPDTLIILSPGFPENEMDSTCLPSQQLFVKLMKKTFPSLHIIVIALQYPFESSEYNWHQCRVIALGGKGRSKIFRLLLWRKAWNKLRQISKENNIIGLLSFWCGEAAWIGNRFGKWYNIKHQSWILGQDAKKQNRYVNRIKPAASELIALSDFIQNEFEKNHDLKPQHIIPIGIDTTQFPPGDLSRDIDVLGVGSLITIKQYEIFVEIIKNLKEQLPEIRAVLCGKGPEEKKLKQLIENYGLQKNISMMGELPHTEVLQQMKRSKLFLHTSIYEGFGVVCIEALYAGIPVISFCHPMDMAIPHWHIVKTKEEMYEKAKKILTHGEAVQFSLIPFTMEATVKKIIELFGYNDAVIS